MSLSLAVNKPSVFKTFAFKAPARALDWADLLGKEVPGDSKKVLSRSSSLLNFAEIPKKVWKFDHSINSLFESDSISDGVEKVIDVFRRLMAILAVFAVGIKIAVEESLLLLSEKQLNILDASCFLSSLALTIYSAKELKKSFAVLFQAEGDMSLNLLKTTARICGLATGIFGMTAFAFGEAMIAKWAVLGVSTVSLSTSIFKYYYNSLV